MHNPRTTIIENARIYTIDRDLPYAQALAVRGGRIVAVGSAEEVNRVSSVIRRVDLEGQVVIPGLIDAHIHFLAYARSLSKVDLDGVRSKEEVLAKVAAKVRETEPGRWVLGGGWNNNLWSPPDFPTRLDLDRIAPHNPVYLDRKDMHSCWVSSLALQRAGITRDTPDPPGAAIGRDEAGEPNGLFFETAVAIARQAIDQPPENAVKAMQRGFRVLASMGLVGFHDCAEQFPSDWPDAFSGLQDLDASGQLDIRVIMLIPYWALDDAIRLKFRTGFGSDHLRIGPVKIFADGSLGSMTAEMLQPFEGFPGNCGIATIPQDEMESAVLRAAAESIPSAIHAIGDAANRRVLDALQKARETARTPLVHRIEHAQLLSPDDVARFARLSVVASMQPLHTTSDMHVADRLWGERARYAYAFKSLLDAGTVLAFGSDAPVETPNPLAGIHAAVTRQDANDLPPQGWYPQERLTVEQAVRAYTESAARSAPYLPGVAGTLTPGSLADLLVLDRDIFQVDPSQIKDAHPLATLIGGRPVYDPQGLFIG